MALRKRFAILDLLAIYNQFLQKKVHQAQNVHLTSNVQ